MNILDFQRSKWAIFSLFCLLLIHCTQAPPVPPESLESTGPIIFPHEASKDWVLAHIDVETTGLIPGYNEMIDMGLVYTTLEGSILDSFFVRIMPNHPERTAPKAAEINGFSVEKWKQYGALNPEEAVDSLVQFHQGLAQNRQALLVAFNSQFDAAFLDHLFRGSQRSWRELYFYYVLDIPSMAWGLGYWDLTAQELMEKYQITDEPHIADLHTGITGAQKNVRVYQALQEHLLHLKDTLLD